MEQIEETLTTIKALGRVKVWGRMFNPQSQSLMVLCEQKYKHKNISLDAPSWRMWNLQAAYAHWGRRSPRSSVVTSYRCDNWTRDTSSRLSTKKLCCTLYVMKDLLLKTMRPTQESNVFWLMSYVLVVVAAAPPYLCHEYGQLLSDVKEWVTKHHIQTQGHCSSLCL